MKLNAKEVLKPALTLFVICVIVSALLAVTNLMTADKIAEAQAQKEQESRQIVLTDAESFEAGENEEYYIGKKGNETVGYVFVTEAKGYGGTIQVMTGIGTDDQIEGIVILSINETPGLGANATKPEFTDMFKQKAQPLEVVKNVAPQEGQIEAMTGATITSKAVVDAVNDAVELYETVKGGE